MKNHVQTLAEACLVKQGQQQHLLHKPIFIY